MQTALGNEQAGHTDVARALELAEPEGFISIFVEEGAPIEEALKNLLKQRMSKTVSTEYIQDILAAFPKTQTIQETHTPHDLPMSDATLAGKSLVLVEPLTGRELEILHLIAEGHSNRAIAEKLVITVSAVKKHTGNIYGKLNVDSRTQAVARARQLKLLSPGV
jgi:LuxR family maltose regulon positive regulatory protein